MGFYMKESEKAIFDKLDVKVIKEMPIIISSLAATGNKIARLFDPLFDDIKVTVEKKISTHRHWKLQHIQKLFHPLSSLNYTSQTKISMLETYFDLEYSFRVTKRIRNKRTNYLWIVFGYWYELSEQFNKNCFYFQIIKEEDYDRYGGVITDLKFYENLKSKFKNTYVEINHPENGAQWEEFRLECPTLDVKKITDLFKIYKSEVVLPLVSKLLKQG